MKLLNMMRVLVYKQDKLILEKRKKKKNAIQK